MSHNEIDWQVKPCSVGFRNRQVLKLYSSSSTKYIEKVRMQKANNMLREAGMK